MLTKNLKIYWHLFKINLKVLFEYRLLFFLELLSGSLWVIGYAVFIEVIFLHTETLAGWEKGETLLLLSFYYVFQTIGEIFFIDNFEAFPLHLRRGELDFHLVKPVSSRMMVFMREMKIQDISHFIVTGVLFAYAINSLSEGIQTSSLLYGLLLTIPSISLYFSINSIIATTALWLEKNDTLRTMSWNLRQIAKYPRQIYKGAFQYIFSFIIPFALLAAIPAEVAINLENSTYLFIFLGLTILFHYFSHWFWHHGLKRYSSAN